MHGYTRSTTGTRSRHKRRKLLRRKTKSSRAVKVVCFPCNKISIEKKQRESGEKALKHTFVLYALTSNWHRMWRNGVVVMGEMWCDIFSNYVLEAQTCTLNVSVKLSFGQTS